VKREIPSLQEIKLLSNRIRGKIFRREVYLVTTGSVYFSIVFMLNYTESCTLFCELVYLCLFVHIECVKSLTINLQFTGACPTFVCNTVTSDCLLIKSVYCIMGQENGPVINTRYRGKGLHLKFQRRKLR